MNIIKLTILTGSLITLTYLIFKNKQFTENFENIIPETIEEKDDNKISVVEHNKLRSIVQTVDDLEKKLNNTNIVVEAPSDIELDRYLIRQTAEKETDGIPSIERKTKQLNNDAEAIAYDKDPLTTNSIGEIGPLLREITQTTKDQVQTIADNFTLINPNFWANSTVTDFENKEGCNCPTVIDDDYVKV